VHASRSGHNLLNKAIAIGIAMALFFSSTSILAWAADESKTLFTGSGRGGGSRPGHTNLKSGNIELPFSMGYIREIHISDSEKPVVIYIQDAHCNYSCQMNIEAIVDYFNQEYGVELAAVEGGAGNYDFSIFTSIPDIEVREAVADYFVREGRVTGVELFAIKNPDKLIVKGLEEPILYEKNLSVYRESLTYKDVVDRYLQILRHYVENLKPPIFSENLKDFDEQKGAYDNNQNKLKDYILYLKRISSAYDIKINKFDNLTRLLGLMEAEQNINFKRAQKEREIVIDELMGKLSKVEIATLVKKSIDFKRDNMAPADFYEYLFGKIMTCDIDLAEYPHLVEYKTHLDRYDNLEKDVFFEEIFDVERYVANNLFSTDDERKLFYLSDDLTILDKLFSVSLTRRQYDYFYENKDDLSAHKFVDFIKEKAAWYNIPTRINPEVTRLDVYKDKVSGFYRYSFERDDVFIKNLEKYSEGREAVFLVTGGFHTENMIDLLKKEDYSYILITPKIAQESYNPYFQLLAGGISPIETVLSEYISVIAIRSVFSEMGLKGDWVYMREAVFAMVELLNEVKARGVGKSDILLSIPESEFSIRITFAKPPEGVGIKVGELAGRELYAIPVKTDEVDVQKEGLNVFYLTKGEAGPMRERIRQLPEVEETAERAIRVERADDFVVVRPRPDQNWRSYATYNPGVIEMEIEGARHTLVFFRAHNHTDKRSSIGLKIIGPVVNKELDEPLIIPHDGFRFEMDGIEDMRVLRMFVPEWRGERLVFTGTALGPKAEIAPEKEELAQIVMFSISIEAFKANLHKTLTEGLGFREWEGWYQHLPFPDNYGKDAVLFPEKVVIDGKEKYAMLYRGPDFEHRNEIRLAIADELNGQWEHQYIVLTASEKWENYAIGAGIPPIAISWVDANGQKREGWLEVYHGVEEVVRDGGTLHIYRGGVAILDKANPAKVIYRSKMPFIQPEVPEEMKGFKSNVVFPTGAVVKSITETEIVLELYYGAADDLAAKALVTIDLERLLSEPLAQGEEDAPREELAEPKTIDEYVESATRLRAEASSAIRPGFKIPVIVEANERMLYSTKSAPDNIVQQMAKLADTQVKALVNHDGKVEFVVSNSRADTVEAIKKYRSQDLHPIVFRLEELGMTDDFSSLLSKHKIPCLVLELQDVGLGKEALVDPFSIAQMAVLVAALNDEVLLGDKADQLRIETLKADIMRLKASLELSKKIDPFPGDPTEILYDGKSFIIVLPRITQLGTNDIENWYRALRKLEASL